LKQTTKDEMLILWGPKFSSKPAQHFVKCSHLRKASVSLSNILYRVICRSCKYFYHLPPHQTFIVWFAYLRA